MDIREIELHDLLPDVFVGMEGSEPIRNSKIWKEPGVKFDRGCRLCIQAESGGGKSSLLSFIYGNRTDYQGSISFDGHDIREFSVGDWCDIRTLNLALLPQEMRLFPELTAMQNVELKNSRTSHKTRREIEEMFERLGISDRMDRLVRHLSVGQQQRVALIRTVCQPFDFIFLDEPVSHLDQRNNRIVAEIVSEEAASRDAGIITTSVGHHLQLPGAEFIPL